MKKGFTLIELLAVIVILAIIALIATPIVLNVIKEAQEGADLRSVEAYAKSIETKYYSEKVKGNDVALTSVVVTVGTDYNGSAVTGCTMDATAAANEQIKLTGCKVGSNAGYSYDNGKATKPGA